MAGSRRGRGGLGGTLGGLGGGTLGTLLRTTLAQAGAVRDALERGARARLDDVRVGRRHDEALAELGAIVLDLVRRGELADLEEFREIADAIAVIEDLEARQAEPAPPPRDRGPPPRARRQTTRRAEPAPRDRDARDADDVEDADFDHESDATRVETPAARRGAPRAHVGDGTVSSRSWSPPRPSAPGRVWRRSVPPDAEPEGDRDHDEETRATREIKTHRGAREEREHATDHAHAHGHERDAEPGAAFREERRRPGGITFGRTDDSGPDPDADLADYMNPDDVPPKK
jgi:hypothetical protein